MCQLLTASFIARRRCRIAAHVRLVLLDMVALATETLRIVSFYVIQRISFYASNPKARMSTSAAPSMITCFGVLRDEQQRGSVLEAERIPHLIPVLEGLHRGYAAKAAEKSSVMAVAHRLREERAPDSVKVQPIRWRGETEDSIRAQLQPVRTRRRGARARRAECTGAARHGLLPIYAAELAVEEVHEWLREPREG